MTNYCNSNSYLGLSSPLDSAKIVIQPVPFDKTTTYQQGADKGPAALIAASCNLELYDIETDSQLSDLGIYTAKAVEAEATADMLAYAYKNIKDFINQGKFVVTLGGEHTVAYPAIRAHLNTYGKISVLQLDAHTDLVPAYEGNKWSHASVMCRVKELLDDGSIVSVGIRSMAQSEREEVGGTTPFFAHTLQGGWIDRVVDALGEQVYITLDLDILDPSIMPATGTPEPGGISWYDITTLLSKVAANRDVVGFDVVELCPIAGLVYPDFLAAKLVYKILSYIFKNKENTP